MLLRRLRLCICRDFVRAGQMRLRHAETSEGLYVASKTPAQLDLRLVVRKRRSRHHPVPEKTEMLLLTQGMVSRAPPFCPADWRGCANETVRPRLHGTMDDSAVKAEPAASRSNENKISHRWRERAELAMDVFS